MAPLASTASLAKTFGDAYRRAVTWRPGMAEGEPSLGPRDNRTTISDGGHPVVSGQWSRSPVSAFTLIEMTVVILIIATLAGLVTTAGSAMFERARRVQAKNDVTQIATAINAFYTEYGRYPVTLTSTTTDAFFGTGATPAGCTSYGNDDVLVDVLRSNTTGANAANVTLLNPRAIVFLSPPAARNTTPPRGGISQTAGAGYAIGDYMDPWGSQYAIEIDTNYDNQLTNPYSDADGSAGTVPLRFGAIAFSYGKNGVRGGGAKASSSFVDESGTAGAFKSSGDLLSWQ